MKLRNAVLTIASFLVVAVTPTLAVSDCLCTVYADCNPGPFWNIMYNETLSGSSAAECAAYDYGSGACISGLGGPDIRNCGWDGNR